MPTEIPEAPPAPVSTPEPSVPMPEPSAPAEEKFIDVDEAVLASLPPEIRQSVVDPLLTKAQTQFKERIAKEREAAGPFKQKAEALEKLIADPRFQKWYYEQQNPPKQTTPGQPKPAIAVEEWNAAYEKAA